ncbi:putative cation/H+ exchanger, sodium/solute symporter superfamily [Dioscorea sansibarensis]
MTTITINRTNVFDPTLGGVNTFGFFHCILIRTITSNGLLTENVTLFDIPLLAFVIQIIFMVSITHVLVAILKPLGQPKIIGEILGGFLLGPSGMAGIQLVPEVPNLGSVLFQGRYFIMVDSFANLGIIYFFFLVGLGTDAIAIKRAGKAACLIASVNLVVPFITAIAMSSYYFADKELTYSYHMLLAVISSMSSAPITSHILANTKLLHTEVGRFATSISTISDAFSWAFFAFFCSISNKKIYHPQPIGSLPSSPIWAIFLVIIMAAIFMTFCLLVVRPAISWLARQTMDDESPSTTHQSIVLGGVLIASLVSDAIGIHPVFGAFIYGLAVPDCPLSSTVIDNIGSFVHTWMLPIFFCAIGLKSNIYTLIQASVDISNEIYKIAAVYIISSVMKLVATAIVGLVYMMSVPEGLCLGFLSNSKGLVEMLVLYIAMDRALITTEVLTMMVLITLAMTLMVSPVVTMLQMPWKQRQVVYKRRNLQKSRPDTELRMLACIHTVHNVPSIIGLLAASNPTKRSPIFVYALHLKELTGHATNMLIVHNINPKGGQSQRRIRGQAQSETIISAFESYEQHAGGVSVQPITAMSPYTSMNEDICAIAGDNHISVIILPFHKEQSLHGGLEVTNPSIRSLNERVLAYAPCTVGILIDRGLGGAAKFAMGGHHVARHVAVVFLGGVDDREALVYAWRMASHPGISLTVLRLIPGEMTNSRVISKSEKHETSQHEVRIINVEADKEQQLDDDFVNEFRLNNVSDETVVYMEKVINNSEETMEAIRSIDSIHDLFIVGKGNRRTTLLTDGLDAVSESQQLGPIGDLLASSELGRVVSVLVLHYNVEGSSSVQLFSPATTAPVIESPKHKNTSYLNQVHQPSTQSWDSNGNWDVRL